MTSDATTRSGSPERASASKAEERKPIELPRSQLPRVEFRLEKRHEIRRLLSIAVAVTLSWTLRVMPAPARRWLATRCGDLTYRFSKRYRANVRDNLRQVLGPGASEGQLATATRNVFRTNTRNLADMLLVPHLGTQDIVDRVRPISGSWAFLDEALSRGRGAVIITAHLGGFDFIGQALHQRGYQLTSVTGRTTSRFLFDAVTFLRRSHNMRLVEASPSGIRNVIRALRRGECAVFLSDRDFFQSGISVKLFGRQTTLPQGPVRIARETGAPIVPIFGIRTGKGHGLLIEPPFEIKKTRDVQADVAKGFESIVAILERAIRSAPDQWVMFERAWPSERDAPSPA